jgi:hypothetical protein
VVFVVLGLYIECCVGAGIWRSVGPNWVGSNLKTETKSSLRNIVFQIKTDDSVQNTIIVPYIYLNTNCSIVFGRSSASQVYCTVIQCRETTPDIFSAHVLRLKYFHFRWTCLEVKTWACSSLETSRLGMSVYGYTDVMNVWMSDEHLWTLWEYTK